MWDRSSDHAASKPSLWERLWGRRWWLVSTALGMSFTAALGLGMFALAQRRGGSAALPLDELSSAWENSTSWNVTKYKRGREQCSYNEGSLLVAYPRGSAGGFEFYSQPAGFPARQACLSYEVYFPPGFPWADGGGLPGLYIGGLADYSAAFVWRANASAGLSMRQPEGQRSVGGLALAEGRWNGLRVCIGLNSAGAHDGSLSATVNDAAVSYGNMLWAPDPGMPISGLTMNTSYDSASPSDTYVRFRAFAAP